MHNWGDEGIDWDGISECAEWIGHNLRKWGRVGVMTKEKYGTVRVYCGFGWYQLFSITHPGYAYSRYPKWLWNLDCKYLSRLIEPLNHIVIPYQKWLYKFLYGRALKKWPHLRAEILRGADWNELLSEYGVHVIRESENGYRIEYDWHPDNYVYTDIEERF